MQIHFSDSDVKKGIFLAGPTPRTVEDSWREDALEILEQMKFEGNVYVPEPENKEWKKDYDDQIDWESYYLNKADAIVFWVPRRFPDLPGLTTNVEFGWHMAENPSKVFYGRPIDAVKCRYLDVLYQKRCPSRWIYTDLQALLKATVDHLLCVQ